MNWDKLKEKFPNSENEIRKHFFKTGIKDGRTLINSFLRKRGYNIILGFINELKDYERRK